MVDKLKPQDNSVVLKFGGGVHSRPSEEDIDPRECHDGENFELDLQNFHYRRRRPFDLIGTAPNTSEIRGFISLKKPSDNSVTLLAQAGDTVYKVEPGVDGAATVFTGVGSVNVNSKLRGRISHNWQLDEEVLITDLNLSDVVMKWDGTTLSDVSFTDENGAAFGDFKAKYLVIENERAIFGNVVDSTPTATPHLIVGSKTSDYTNITVSNLPSSALGEDDPYYLITPDLRDINGMAEGFNIIAVSTNEGKMHKLIGASAKDFSFGSLHPESGGSGDESVTYVGNDIFYGRPGRIESLLGSDRFGDTENNDLTVGISDLVDDFDDWVIEYNQRTQKVYCYSEDTSQIWVYYKPLANSPVSPWSKMTTLHSMNMNPTALMRCYNPIDGLEYVYFGDGNGNIYRMEGDNIEGGDGGINSIKTFRESALLKMPLNTEAFGIQGWCKYRVPQEDVTVRMCFDFQGTQIYRHEFDIVLRAAGTRNYFNGGIYFGGGAYFGSVTGRFAHEIFPVPGQSSEFQVTATIEQKTDFSINEIGLRFTFSDANS